MIKKLLIYPITAQETPLKPRYIPNSPLLKASEFPYKTTICVTTFTTSFAAKICADQDIIVDDTFKWFLPSQGRRTVEVENQW